MTTMQAPLMQLRHVTKAYETGGDLFSALKDVSFEIQPGEFLGITGKSGAGKTTLLNMISGVSGLTTGEVLFNGKGGAALPIHAMNEDALAIWRGQNVGIVYQSFELMPTLNLVENVMLPPDFLGTYNPVISKTRALELLELVEIAEHAYKIPAHISGGQKQRVAIARAMINDPDLIIADEPTGNLDTVTAETIFQIFQKLVDRGKTIVMVTHDESFAPRFSRRLHIVDGVVGDPDETLGSGADLSAAHAHTSGGNAQVLMREDRPCGEVDMEPVKAGQAFPAIALHNVHKVYENAAGKFVALKSIDLELNYGQFISIVGKSGCGKSTLLNMITGIDHPTSGEVIIGNERIYGMNNSQLALWRGKNMGVVFQFFQLLPTLTLLENTMLPMDYCKVYPFNERPQRAMELLKLVGLEAQAHQLPAAVSSGQQQSAAIARALATDPSIILADEPTGNLDSKSAENILRIFENLAAQGKTVLIVTHDPSITQRTDQTIIMSDGEIIDQTVARALPYLSHPQMLAATHQAVRRMFDPGVTILHQGETVDHLFMIVSGAVEIVVSHEGTNEISLACLGPGQFFGEVELHHGGGSLASVRAAARGAEVALLPRSVFNELVESSILTRQIVQDVATTRLAEHRSRKASR
ncbi:MAG: ATP-binding cassette domain-containing protein [Caldilineaceae bacterium]|nr:ATP-binding cassette domain-containing protein [Caldilineaceae bacterium]MBP8108808.1 ATP-binding cassette domain-containing protein [Caldilineaceae bacterium]MBP8123942.1 ATP-binding cassette domain-containing protein [Caldilineaceae bacterium]MBP9073467.1 ATP-binding cassette domain-containing protein [Caldilineaceae bacterium]